MRVGWKARVVSNAAIEADTEGRGVGRLHAKRAERFASDALTRQDSLSTDAEGSVTPWHCQTVHVRPLSCHGRAANRLSCSPVRASAGVTRLREARYHSIALNL